MRTRPLPERIRSALTRPFSRATCSISSASSRFRGAKSACPVSVAKGRCRAPSQYRPAAPSPVPAERMAWFPVASLAPGCKVARSVGPRCRRP